MTLSATLSRNFPTLRYIAAPFRWVFGSRQRRRTAAAVLLAMIAAPVLWWNVQLMGLPDIGEPFDIEAYKSFTIPEERNAFVLYRRAAALLKPPAQSGAPRADDLAPFSKVPVWSAAPPGGVSNPLPSTLAAGASYFAGGACPGRASHVFGSDGRRRSRSSASPTSKRTTSAATKRWNRVRDDSLSRWRHGAPPRSCVTRNQCASASVTR